MTTKTWAFTSNRVETISRLSSASRDIVCFAVLDFDSLTAVKMGDGDDRADITALLYKKITIHHEQTKQVQVEGTNTDGTQAIKFFAVPDIAIAGETPATDAYSYSGTRTTDYILCVLVGTVKTAFSLGTLVATVVGQYNVSGGWADILNGSGTIVTAGPTHTITGSRLNGVSVYVGDEYVVFSYDEERFEGVPSGFDSPLNHEDCNTGWVKVARVVGLIELKTMTLESKRYETDQFDGKVYAVAYQKEE